MGYNFPVTPERKGERGRRVRFDHFEIDFATGDVWKHGVRVRLRGQPLEILEILIQRAGELVTREEIRRRLWPDQTTVEFDHSINIAVNRIRTTLGAKPSGGTYVETLRGQGYRFLGAVEPEEAEPEIGSPGGPAEPARSAGALTRRKGPLWIGIGIAAIVLVTMVLGLARRTNPQPSGVPEPFLAAAGDQDHAQFAPDGRMAAYLWRKEGAANFDVYVKMIGAGEPLRLTKDAAEKFSPVWSPDGREIAFVRQAAEGKRIFAVPALGGADRRLGGVTVTETDISWSRDGKWIAYLSGPEGGGRDRVHLLATASGETKALTNPETGLGDRSPVFSPDGGEVAFVRIGVLPRITDIYVVRTAGGAARRVAAEMGQIAGLAWTADGREIVFSANPKGLRTLWRVPAAGGAAQRVSIAGYNAGYNSTNPAISNAGALAYTENSTNINIWRYHTGGGAPEKAIGSSRNQHSPRYSPDGARIAFVSDRGGSEEIWISDKDGEGARQLTSFQEFSAGSPSWSPDGRWIAFDARPGQNADIYAISPEGGAPRRLTSDASREILPSWSRDGKWIYFCSDRTGNFEIWRMPSGGGAAERITRAGGFESMESLDGRYLYYTKGRQAGMFRRALDAGGGAGEEPAPEMSGAGQWRYWEIGSAGYYYAAKGAGPFPSLYRFDEAKREAALLTVLQKPADVNGSGLTVAPDGSAILFTQVDQRIRDVMLVNGFR